MTSFLPYLTLVVLPFLPAQGIGQGGPEFSSHEVWYIPGANVGAHGDTNLFTRTYCHKMNEIMGSRFHVVSCKKRPFAVGNVFWALWNGQYPMKNPLHDRRIRNSFEEMVSDTLFRKSEISLVSCSFGTVVAAQLALYLVNNIQEPGLNPVQINLVFGSSMLSKESPLFRSLLRAQSDNRIGLIIYDELQTPGDNVTGMCGTTRLYALSEVCRIAFPFIGKYHGQPSILNDDPVNGHVHRKREVTAGNVMDYITPFL